MKLQWIGSKLAVLFLLLTLLPIVAVSGGVITQNSQKQGRLENTLKWNPHDLQIFSVDSRLDLEFPDLAPDADWIVGVQTTKSTEKETISANQVSWENSDRFPAFEGKRLKTKLVSGFTDYPAKKIQVTRGTIRLRGLSNFDANSGSLIVHLKVSPETQVHIWRNGKEIISRFPITSFVVHNGVLTNRPIHGIHSLVGSLIRSKIPDSQIERGNGIRLTKLMFKDSLSSRITPVRAVVSSKILPFQEVTCTTSWSDEETDTCYSANVTIRCSAQGETIECSVTVSACDDGSGGVIIALTGGCTS